MFEHRQYGDSLKLSIRGASHAPFISFSLEGFPAGFKVDVVALAEFMARRAPGRDRLSTPRKESDEVEFLDGLENFVTTGGAISGRIMNKDQRPEDYGCERTVPRPGHADFGQWIEYGRIPTGGGINSGRMTVAIAAAGGLALQYLSSRGIEIKSEVVSIGGKDCDFEKTIAEARDDSDSVGGVVRCVATAIPAGLGGALFAGVESKISSAVFAIPGVKGVEFGNGAAAASTRGSLNNDSFAVEDGAVVTGGNNHGGVLGGRTSGMPLVFNVAMKPTPTIFKKQKSVDLATMQSAESLSRGRHDPCIVLRALPVIEAVAALALADMVLAAERATPRICLVLTASTIEGCLAQYASQRYFADMVELRVDKLLPEERKKASLFPSKVPVPAILTFRRKSDGGDFIGEESERAEFFREALLGEKPFAYVDFEDDFRIGELESLARASSTRIIRSLHLFDRTPADIGSECRRLRGVCGDIPKIAFMPESADDVARLLSGNIDCDGQERILCAMGPVGVASRILSVRTGSMLSYASIEGLGGIGHLSPHELVKTYRFRNLNRDFALYGVTGWPLERTSSPAIHNAVFAAADIDAVMIPLPCKTAAEALGFMKSTGMKGLAVTIPHKQSIMPLLDEIDESARKIGAVNTVVCRDGKYIGYNTDADGFASAFAAFAGDFAGRKAAILGAGGAALAVSAALEKLGLEHEVFHRRTPDAGFDFIINATPVDPIPDYSFGGGEAVYDLRYVPEVTELLARAAAAGCRTENGYSMLTAQAAGQRKIWFPGVFGER